MNKQLLGLIFDSHILFEVSQNMCLAALKKQFHEKSEEDLYVIDKNISEVVPILQQLRNENTWDAYLRFLRQFTYKAMPKYSSVFQHGDPSSYIYFILRGEVVILLPDFGFNDRSLGVHGRSEKGLELLKSRFVDLKEIFDSHLIEDYQIERQYENQSDGDDDDDDDGDDGGGGGGGGSGGGGDHAGPPDASDKIADRADEQEPQNPWGSDERIIKLLYPTMKEFARVQRDGCFGELACEFSVPRNATVVCLTDCEFAMVPAQGYCDLPYKLHQNKALTSRLFKVNQMFASMGPEQIHLIASNLVQRTFTSDTMVFNIGDTADNIYFVEKGSVQIFQNFEEPASDNNQEGEKQIVKHIVADYSNGSYFGEDGIFMNREKGKRVTQVFAKKHTAVFQISGDFLYNNLKAFVEGGRFNPSERKQLKKQETTSFRRDESFSFSESNIRMEPEKDKESKDSSSTHSLNDILNTRSLKPDLFSLLKVLKDRKLSSKKPQMDFKIKPLYFKPDIVLQKQLNLEKDKKAEEDKARRILQIFPQPKNQLMKNQNQEGQVQNIASARYKQQPSIQQQLIKRKMSSRMQVNSQVSEQHLQSLDSSKPLAVQSSRKIVMSNSQRNIDTSILRPRELSQKEEGLIKFSKPYSMHSKRNFNNSQVSAQFLTTLFQEDNTVNSKKSELIAEVQTLSSNNKSANQFYIKQPSQSYHVVHSSSPSRLLQRKPQMSTHAQSIIQDLVHRKAKSIGLGGQLPASKSERIIVKRNDMSSKDEYLLSQTSQMMLQQTLSQQLSISSQRQLSSSQQTGKKELPLNKIATPSSSEQLMQSIKRVKQYGIDSQSLIKDRLRFLVDDQRILKNNSLSDLDSRKLRVQSQMSINRMQQLLPPQESTAKTASITPLLNQGPNISQTSIALGGSSPFLEAKSMRIAGLKKRDEEDKFRNTNLLNKNATEIFVNRQNLFGKTGDTSASLTLSQYYQIGSNQIQMAAGNLNGIFEDKRKKKKQAMTLSTLTFSNLSAANQQQNNIPQ